MSSLKFATTFLNYENRALTPSTFRPKPILVETTKACAPVFAPYFMAGVGGGFFFQTSRQILREQGCRDSRCQVPFQTVGRSDSF